ncbi:Penicillin-binding protein 1F [Vibrio aerogenes CECT 7868]|uniref:peptidoglycan glycosyltransferase n=1 Tax=Vibrio aerogenes CECT 7868 TaxID=1216006 RepID=A0A1M5ZKI5_9VIBR|nr:penicillin-binding protein 1C [Vibrio aerogenes]SHI24688.1 Penicillin-binding protein 1F [Vibrio aerogenes CECT 7868]
MMKRFCQICLITVGSLCGLFVVLNLVYPLDINRQAGPTVSVYSAEGDVLRQFASQDGVFRIPVTRSHVSPLYLAALLEYEDKYFFSHPGFNPFSLVRALVQQIYYGRVISGGSTLTMQVARKFYPHPRTYRGKLMQIFRALQLELHYSKEEILSLYLTYAPMGGNIEGVEAASQRYFGKHASELSLTEAVMLVVVPQRPSLYRPDRFPQRARKARNKVLKRVAKIFPLSGAELERMVRSPMLAGYYPAPLHAPLLARRLQQQHPEQSDIHTFIDYTVESDLESIIGQRTARWSTPLSAAVMVMDNLSGKVIAYKGSADMNDPLRYGYVDMVHALRSPGSALKPFIYGLALDQGLVHSASLLTDVPRQFGDYSPHNFDHLFQGPVRLDHALQTSRNVPAVQLLSHIGPERFLQWLTNAGIHLHVPEANLALALGGEGIRLKDLVTLFSALGRTGDMIFPRFSSDDDVRTVPLFSPAASWIIRSMLMDIAPPDRVKAAHNRPVAWKTGTSYGYRDAWAIGTSADYTVGVWVGRPDGAPFVGQTGANQAGPLMFDVFDLLPEDQRTLSRPDSVTTSVICWPGGIDVSLVRPQDCLQHQQALTINHFTPATLKHEQELAALHQWPQPLLDWSRKTGHTLVNEPESQETGRLRILVPRQGTQLFPYPGQMLNLMATKPSVSWFLNDQPLHGSQIPLDTLSAGNYRLTACITRCDTIDFAVY